MKNTKEMIEVMQAYCDGCEIETVIPGAEWWVPSEPSWNWPHHDYRIKDPYAELKAAAQDPTKQIRDGGLWQDAGHKWNWTFLPEAYEIRDKPRAKKQIKLMAWYDGGRLFWQSDEYKVSRSCKRVPMQDKVIEIEE